MRRKRFESRNDQVAYLRSCGPTCSPKQLAEVMGGRPYYYNQAARDGTLGYEFEWHGRNLRIFTESVIKKLLCI